jgi:hypothetical protein
MTTPQEDLKQRLATVLADLNAHGAHDGETMFMLGSIATRLCDGGGKPSWSTLKPALSKAGYNQLLKQFQDEGRQLVAAGKTKAAYAVQALAVSLVAHSQVDPVLREGEKLLDAIIDRTVANFRKHAQPHLSAN